MSASNSEPSSAIKTKIVRVVSVKKPPNAVSSLPGFPPATKIVRMSGLGGSSSVTSSVSNPRMKPISTAGNLTHKISVASPCGKPLHVPLKSPISVASICSSKPFKIPSSSSSFPVFKNITSRFSNMPNLDMETPHTIINLPPSPKESPFSKATNPVPQMSPVHVMKKMNSSNRSEPPIGINVQLATESMVVGDKEDILLGQTLEDHQYSRDRGKDKVQNTLMRSKPSLMTINLQPNTKTKVASVERGTDEDFQTPNLIEDVLDSQVKGRDEVLCTPLTKSVVAAVDTPRVSEAKTTSKPTKSKTVNKRPLEDDENNLCKKNKSMNLKQKEAVVKQKFLKQMKEKRTSKFKYWECNECKKLFASYEKALYHVNQPSCHIVGKKKPQKSMCYICNEVFPSKTDLYNHYDILHNERLMCSKCPKAEFKSQRNLTRHIKTVHGDSVYQCPECDRSFNRVDSRIRHMKIHQANTVENPFFNLYENNLAENTVDEEV